MESRLGRRLLVQKGPADKQPVSTKQSYSYGGGTNTLFAHEHPELVDTVISLENRRMPFPRTTQPRVFSIRSSDQPADDGAIPSPEEQAKLGMKVVKLPATIYNDMWDGGTEEQKAEIIRHIDAFLHE